MAKIRIGLGSEFNLNNGNLGLGVTNPQVRLDVDGTVKSKDFEVTGVTSFTAYEGFLRSDHQIDGDLTLNTGQGLNASLSGEIIVKDGVTVTVGAIGLGTTSVGVGTELITTTIDSNETNLAGGSEIECLKVYNTFTPPSGGTNERPEAPKPGELYYNFDFKTIEFFDGYGWRQVDNTTRSGRGLFGGGIDPSVIATIQSVQISTRGNAQVFGDLSVARNNDGGFGNETRGVFAGGQDPTRYDVIDYVTIASSGNAIDFGNLLEAKSYIGGLSSSTRGILAGGYSPENNVIQYVQINTTGNALDFGDLTLARLMMGSCTASPTRGVMGGGWLPSSRASTIDSITIASTGDAIDFGDLTQRKSACSAGSTGTRAVWAGGYFNGSNHYKTIEYITIASGGNGIDFGERTFAGAYSGAASSHTRLVTCMGFTPSLTNRMESIEMATGGDAIDFGDAVNAASGSAGCSDSHGGLGGF
jgi:hypothetical protein